MGATADDSTTSGPRWNRSRRRRPQLPLGAAASAGGVAPSTYRLFGTVNDDPDDTTPQILVEIDHATGAATSLGLTDAATPLAPAFDPRRGRDKVWYAEAIGFAAELRMLDPVTRTSTVVGPMLITDRCYGMAYDPAEDCLYALSRSTALLFKVDPYTAEATFIGPTDAGALFGLMIDDRGRLLSMIVGRQDLVEIDKQTAEVTVIGNTGARAIVDIQQDPSTGIVYATDTLDDVIYTIDLETGAATLLGPYGAEVEFLVGLFFTPTEATPYVLDFEFDDDFERRLHNGQSIAPGEEFGRLVTIFAHSTNAGPAIFDSRPSGPNAGGPDPDLLVDQGNVLILQDLNATAQTTPDTFDVPNDALLGGGLVFAFTMPSSVRSIDLIDICPGVGDATVTLTDTAGAQRIYFVPAGWTSDIAALGGAGVGTLDLTTLEGQRGFLTTAIATEDEGFDPSQVVELLVSLASSGAVDNLVFLPAN